MKRMTTTKQISNVLSNNLLTITKAECYHKTTRQTDLIEPDSFLENLQFLCESGCFMDCVGWHFMKDCLTNQYILETGRMDGDSENIVIVHLRTNEDVSDEEVKKALIVEGED